MTAGLQLGPMKSVSLDLRNAFLSVRLLLKVMREFTGLISHRYVSLCITLAGSNQEDVMKLDILQAAWLKTKQTGNGLSLMVEERQTC